MTRGLDHLVLAVRDLDAAAAFYTRLGFQVGGRNLHPWGTQNRIVQFAGTFLELITVADAAAIPPHGPRAFSFGAFVRDALRLREGLAMVVLDSTDATADAAAFAKAGIGDYAPFAFERRGMRPDGTEVRVAFSLAFARDARAPDAGVFVCQQHEPQNFWNAAFQVHPNGASGVTAVTMAAENPTDHHIFLSAFTGARDLHSTSLGIRAQLSRGAFEIATPTAVKQLYGVTDAGEGTFTGYDIAVPDLEALAEQLSRDAIPCDKMPGRVVVGPGAAFGAAIAFIAR